MRRFLKLFFLITFFIVLATSFVNWYVDPMWAFSHKQPFLDLKEEFDERQQKTNLVYFRDFNYDGIMLGSSKITIIDQHTIKDYKVFNCSANAMSLYEFNNFIEFAKKKNKKPFKVIVLGMDFWSIAVPAKINTYDFDKIMLKTKDPFYRIKLLLSTDALQFSKTNIYFNIKPSAYAHHFKIYNQNYIAYTLKKDPRIIKYKIDNYSQPNKDIIYNREVYLKCLKELKKNNPDTKFVLITTPPNAPWFHTIMLEKHTAQSYKQWLTDLINVFGAINHFAYINSVTKDYPNTYVDPGHYSSEIGKMMIDFSFHQSIDQKLKQCYPNFGIVLNKNNFDIYVDRFIDDAKAYKIKK